MLTCIVVVIWNGIACESGEFFWRACVSYSIGCGEGVGEEGNATRTGSTEAVQELEAGWVGHVSDGKILLAVIYMNEHVHLHGQADYMRTGDMRLRCRISRRLTYSRSICSPRYWCV